MHATLFRLLAVCSAAAALLAGCSKDSSPGAPVCDGITKDGVCYALCDDKLDCKGGQICARSDASDPGKCHAPCAATAECVEGQACAAAMTTSGTAAKVCAPRTPAGIKGSACAAPTDCDTDHGLTCAGGACVGAPGYGCKGAADCDAKLVCAAGKCKAPGAAGDACAGAAECAAGLVCSSGTCLSPGDSGAKCAAKSDCKADLSCVGGLCGVPCSSAAQGSCPAGTQCEVPPSGKGGVCLPQDVENGPGQYGTSCPHGDSDCDGAAGFSCVGVIADEDAYCTKLDGCAKDGECPSGMWCGEQQQLDAKGNILIGMGRRACQPRAFCAPCSGDVDCSLRPGAICVPDANGEKYCALPCDPTTNSCAIGVACVDVGGGVNACRPDAGSCHTKNPQACSPCRNDADCGAGGVCMDGSVYGIPGLSWCSTPCGPPDAAGKPTCPKALNGEQTVCLATGVTAWGDQTFGGPPMAFKPGYQDHCVAPYVTQNLPLYAEYDPNTMLSGPQHDPEHDVCGNGRREKDEECDDGLIDGKSGCGADCKVTADCRFIAGPGSSDTATDLTDATGATFPKVKPKCKSFLVTGDIESAGDVDSFLADIESGGAAYVDVFTDSVGACTADLVAEAREGLVDVATPCNQLNAAISNATAQCSSTHLSCGPCGTPKPVCGICADEGGPGNCPRFIASTNIYYYQYKVDNTSVQKTFRIYAKDKAFSGAHYLMLVSHGYVDKGHQSGGEDFPDYPPAPSCWY